MISSMWQAFGRAALAKQMICLCVLFLVPLAVAMVFITDVYNMEIEFSTLELRGNRLQRPLTRLLYWMPEHGRRKGSGERIEAEREIEAALTDLEAMNVAHGEALQFTSEGLTKRKREHYRVEQLRREWRQLKEGQTPAPGRDHLAHYHLVEDIRVMITHAGDTSNLILDPDLDSYYLMDITLLALPQTLDRWSRIGRTGDGAEKSKKALPASTQMAIEAALLRESDLGRITGSAGTALNEDANFYGVSQSLQANLPTVMRSYEEANNSLLALMDETAKGRPTGVRPEALARAVGLARKRSLELWEMASRELDVLLETRVAHSRKGRLFALALTFIALLITGIFAGFTIRRLRAVLRRAIETVENGVEDVANTSEQIMFSAQTLARSPSENY